MDKTTINAYPVFEGYEFNLQNIENYYESCISS